MSLGAMPPRLYVALVRALRRVAAEFGLLGWLERRGRRSRLALWLRSLLAIHDLDDMRTLRLPSQVPARQCLSFRRAVVIALATLAMLGFACWRRLPIWRLIGAALWLGVFFLGLAALAVATAGLLGGGGTAPSAPLGGAFLLAWTAGFLVPGAPGGLGVREAAFFLLAEPLIAPETAIAGALLLRLITSLGDLFLPLALGRG